MRPRPSRPARTLAALAACSALVGCRPAVPDPRDAVRAYADAAARGDAASLHAMLTENARRSLSEADVARLVAGERAELGDAAKALTGPHVAVKGRATLRWADGESAALELVDGGFRISGADALPASAKTPTEALGALRRVLARRSYAGLLRVLSPATRGAIEADLRSLVEGLDRPEGLDVRVSGDVATVAVPGGHEVRLRREGGAWHVEDFD